MDHTHEVTGSNPVSPISTASPLDTFLRGLDKLTALAPDMRALEDTVASREADLLRKVLVLLDPVFSRLATTIAFREPWLDQREPGQGKKLREKGVVLFRNFHQ